MLFVDTGKKTAYWKTRNANTASSNGEEDKAEDTTENGGTEIQYLIKWLGFSHLHNTWESGMEYWLVVTCKMHRLIGICDQEPISTVNCLIVQ